MPSSKAVVCGINEYGSPQNNLPSCVNDARAVARVLQEQYGFQDIHVVLDRDATVANVEKELAWLVKGASPGDRLVCYYSGHGFTKMVGEVMREFLVLLDEAGKPALWEDDKLVAITRETPAGCDPTVLLDSCYSGGMFKWIFDPSESIAEAAKIKVYQPPPEEQTKDFVLPESPGDGAVRRRVTAYRQFGRSPNTSAAAVAKSFGTETSSSWPSAAAASKTVSDESEAAQPELKGLLISACLETETAAASTARTNGLSAFTCALLQVIADGARGKPARQVFDETAAKLATLGFRQTPTWASSGPGNLANCAFITMEEGTMTATTVQPASTPETPGNGEQEVQKRVVEGIVTMLPRLVEIIGAQLAQSKDVEVDEEAAGSADPSGDEIQKFLPALMAIATLAPKIPGAVDAVRNIVAPRNQNRHRVVRPMRKDFALDGDDPAEKSLQSAALSMLPMLLTAASRALEGRSSR